MSLGVIRRVGLVLLAPVVGVCGVLVHRQEIALGGARLPWGLMLALAGVVALVVLLHLQAVSRWWVAAGALGWAVPVLVASIPTGSGDLLMTQEIVSLVFVFGGVLPLGIGVGLPPRGAQHSAPGITLG